MWIEFNLGLVYGMFDWFVYGCGGGIGSVSGVLIGIWMFKDVVIDVDEGGWWSV